MSTTTRRCPARCTIAVAPVALTASAAALPTTFADTSEFAIARRAVRTAERAADTYRRDVFDPAWARYSRLTDTIPIAELGSPEHAAALDATGFLKVEEDYGPYP